MGIEQLVLRFVGHRGAEFRWYPVLSGGRGDDTAGGDWGVVVSVLDAGMGSGR